MHLVPYGTRRRRRVRLWPLRSWSRLPGAGYVSLMELQSVRGKLKLSIEHDLHFEADKYLSECTDDARRRSHFVTRP
jgi:hypothetical protein